MKDHRLPAKRHDDDDDCPETTDPPMEITGSGGIVIQAPKVEDEE